MAVSGGATGAFRCQVQGNELTLTGTTTLRQLCVPVEQAVLALSKGEMVTVQATEMAKLREALGKHNVRG